jgi:hypothetical protein
MGKTGRFAKDLRFKYGITAGDVHARRTENYGWRGEATDEEGGEVTMMKMMGMINGEHEGGGENERARAENVPESWAGLPASLAK